MRFRLTIVICVLSLAALACNMPAPGSLTPTAPTLEPGTAQALLSVTPGRPGQEATTPATQPAIPSDTPAPSATEQPCNQAEFVADVTVPDGAKMTPGQAFSKTWRLRNTGACAWTAAYALVFADGDALGAPAVVSLPGNIPPGATADLTIDMKAPSAPGKYYSDWMLRNASGQLFGVDGSQPIYVQIEVASPITATITFTPTPTLTPVLTLSPTVTRPASGVIYDFAANACQATWRSLAGILPCEGKLSDVEGSVTLPKNVTLESNTVEPGPVLLTQPQFAKQGAITGLYPPITIQSGDRFTASLGCMTGATTCSVIYQVNYLVGSATPVNLGQWQQTYDGTLQNVTVDLSSLNGKTVQIILVVLAGDSAEGDQAVWINPRIVR